MIPWRGPKTSLQGCKHTPRLRQGSLQDGLGPRTRRRQQKSQFMQGPFGDGKGLTRQQALSGRRQQKFHFVQGPFHDGKGLTGNKPIPGRGASKKSHFRQGSFADGKGRTGNKGRGADKIPFQAGVVCRWQGPDRQEAYPGRGASKKSYFRQGSCAEGKGLTGNTPIPGRGASKKPHFRQGSFADGKGRTGKKPTLARAQAKNPISGRGRVQRARAGPARRLPWQGRRQKILFQAGVVCRRQGLDREHAHSRGASKKSYFRQGSFADGKGRTGKKPTLAGAQAKNPISGRGRAQRARA